MKKIILWILILFSSVAVADESPGYQMSTLATGLQYPYSLAFLPDGDILATEKTGQLRLIHEGVLIETPVANVPDVDVGYQGGLLDIALHPQFSKNRQLYFSLTQGKGEHSSLRVFRAQYISGVTKSGQLINVSEIFQAPETPPIALGGRLLFLPDETLLVSVGDGFDYREQAQNLESTLGKIIRINDDGTIPKDNPFLNQDGVTSAVYSYGHRVAIGLFQDKTTQTVYAHENGPKGGDELNRIEAGKNYGWPIASYGIAYSGGRVSPFSQYPGTEQPLVQWTPSIAPSGLTQCRGCQWPEWEGDLLVGFLAGRQARRIILQEGVVTDQKILFKELGERIRDLRFGPDGALYMLTDNINGRVIKVTPLTQR